MASGIHCRSALSVCRRSIPESQSRRQMKDPIETLLDEEGRFEPPTERASRSLVPDYEAHFRRSPTNLEGHSDKIARELTWSAASIEKPMVRRVSTSEG